MDKTTTNPNTTRHELGGLESCCFRRLRLIPLLRISALVSLVG